MQITEIRVKLVANRTDRLKAFATITFDDAFVVRDLKIIEGADGFFVAMPSRKLTDRCQACGAKNTLRSRFCNDCGARLGENRLHRDAAGRTKLHADVAHPVNSQCRTYIQSEIVNAYQRELELSHQPDYKPTELGDDYEDYVPYDQHAPHTAAAPPAVNPYEAVPPPPAEATPPATEEPAPPDEPDDRPSSFSDGIL